MTFVSLWGPVLAHMALIFVVSSFRDPVSLPEHFSDKLAHLAIYALLGLLILRALSGGRAASITWRRIAIAVALCIAYGVSDELHQSMVPGRTPDVLDVAADAVGAALGAAALVSLGVLRRIYFGDSQST